LNVIFWEIKMNNNDLLTKIDCDPPIRQKLVPNILTQSVCFLASPVPKNIASFSLCLGEYPPLKLGENHEGTKKSYR